MPVPFEFALGWRYTRAGRSTRRNGFISFISGVSMMGIALGVAALIIVMSVMNGFQKNVRDRMLSVMSHVEIFAPDGAALPDAQRTLKEAQQNPEVMGAAPFIGSEALIARGDTMKGAVVRGIDPAQEKHVSDIAITQAGALAELAPGEFNVVIGSELARLLHASTGDFVTLLVPGGQVTPAGVLPRLKQMKIAGIFESGHYLYDSSLVFMHLEDAQRLFRLEGPTGIRLRLQSLYDAPKITRQLANALSGYLYIRDWTMQNPTWFAAVKMEKRMLFIILTLIVAVAAFNLVSTLVMSVTDKQSDIAILRTLGASPGSIMGVFMVQGALIGVIGTLSGLALGLLIAFNIDIIVPALEHLFDAQFLPKDVYLITKMPSDPQAGDILPVALISLLLSFAATLYPSWRASRVNPAEALRYE